MACICNTFLLGLSAGITDSFEGRGTYWRVYGTHHPTHHTYHHHRPSYLLDLLGVVGRVYKVPLDDTGEDGEAPARLQLGHERDQPVVSRRVLVRTAQHQQLRPAVPITVVTSYGTALHTYV